MKPTQLSPSLRSNPRPPRLCRLLAGAVGTAVLVASQSAFAQADLNPPLPNVLLLVDTSGSMEFKVDGSPPVCTPNLPDNSHDRSRWIDLVEVLTGTIDEYSCEALERSTVQFANSYKFGSDENPYDYSYPLPYHRPLSNGCGPAPGTPFTSGQNPFKYPQTTGSTRSIGFHQYNYGAACNNGWSQPKNDGILDTFRQLVRFGLMTFDTSVDDGRGYSGQLVHFASGNEGLWSYIVGSDAARGQPYGCNDKPAPEQEVGARNNAAPPWEGRLINFGNPDDGVRAYETKNTQIQEVLIATRPYGATPIAGMLKDARDFLLEDKNIDLDPIPSSPAPTGAKADFGPHADPYLECGRKQAVLLLTDGLPNMDLRPACEQTAEIDGECPFPRSEETAKELKDKGIPTYVVGFALDKADDGSGVEKDCDKVNCSGVTLESAPALQACCALEKIALAGSEEHAYFASDKSALRSHIHDILEDNVPTTSRTQPAVAPGGVGSGSYRFFSGFTPGQRGTSDAPGRPWEGVLDRQRWVCEPDSNQNNLKVPKALPVSETDGDKFVWNVGRAGPDQRLIYTYMGGDSDDPKVFSRNSMRPLIPSASADDGVGDYGAYLRAGTSSNFIDLVKDSALEIPTPNCKDDNGTQLDPGPCRQYYLKWLLGYSNGNPHGYHRCPSAGGQCKLIGDIFHSTPQIVTAPVALTRDESYARFALAKGERPTVLYTSTNDGFLHAFRVDTTNDDENNELWAFIPPATLPNLYTQYPFTHGFLLDGIPVISDVVAVDPSPDTALPTVFERTSLDAQGGENTWRTVLVQSFGSEQTGYFALDVTDPVPDKGSPSDLTKGGPRMLWQLTNAGGKNLFGRGGATPAITTLFFVPEGGTEAREIPVAILPGGPGGSVLTDPSPVRNFDDVDIDDKYKPREQVRSYNLSETPGARSLTIVRLDSGEIIRTFRQKKTEITDNDDLQKRVTEVPTLDSPVTGQPVAYPGLVGAVADRVFVGDNDGRLWKLDVSSRDPAEWKMQLFFDLYPAKLNGSPSGLDFDDGQPVMTIPALSVDEIGNVTVNIATGDQDALGAAPNQVNFVYSLTDKLDPATFKTKPKLNWYTKFTAGERVVGPLALFNSFLYFASFKPAEAGTPCKSGESRVWGMHYIEQEKLTATGPGPAPEADPAAGGRPAPDFPEQYLVQTNNAVVFGVSVVQQPSCYELGEEAATDAFLGFGSRKRFTNVQTGKFQLVMHMGDTAAGSSNTSNTNSGVTSNTIDLTPPANASQVTGWASVLE
jgi:type IV pilus assembly protein PilY1